MAMLHFNRILVNVSVRQNPRVSLWITTQQLAVANSTVSNSNQQLNPLLSITEDKVNSDGKKEQKKISTEKSKHGKFSVQSLFVNKDGLNTMEELLSSYEKTREKPELCLEIISKLSNLVHTCEVKYSDFESDPRYKSICAALTGHKGFTGVRKKKTAGPIMKNVQPTVFVKNIESYIDMNDVQKIADNPNMYIDKAIQLMSKLAINKSRVIPLLQLLANHIVNFDGKITTKQSSDILFSMAVLNFYDEVLLEKISSNLVFQIPNINPKYRAVVGSVLKSVGLLRYRNELLLNILSLWMMDNFEFARPQEIHSFLVTLAILNYLPESKIDKFKNLVQNLKEDLMADSGKWLDVVWALVVLNKADQTQVLSVLDTTFVERLSAVSNLSQMKKQKLLNINAAAKLIFKSDTGQPFDQHPFILDVTLERNKEKLEFVNTVISDLLVLLPASGFLKKNVNTGNGFLLDAEFYVDKNSNPVPIDKVKFKKDEALRLGIVSQSYHDFCRGDEQVTGPIDFQCKLLNLSGYQVISIPYKEFSTNQKIVERIKYLKDKIQTTVKQCSN